MLLEIHQPKDTSCIVAVKCMSKNDNLAVRYFFKVIDEHVRIIYEIYSKLTMNTLDGWSWVRSGVFIVYFEQILHGVSLF